MTVWSRNRKRNFLAPLVIHFERKNKTKIFFMNFYFRKNLTSDGHVLSLCVAITGRMVTPRGTAWDTTCSREPEEYCGNRYPWASASSKAQNSACRTRRRVSFVDGWVGCRSHVGGSSVGSVDSVSKRCDGFVVLLFVTTMATFYHNVFIRFQNMVKVQQILTGQHSGVNYQRNPEHWREPLTFAAWTRRGA